jgi:ketosteroid isomerase-like protein
MKTYISALCIIASAAALVAASAKVQSAVPREAQVRSMVQRYVKEINRTNSPNVFDEFLAADYTWHLAGKNVVGREAVKASFARNFGRNKDVRLTADDVIVAGHTAVVRWTISGVERETGKPFEHAHITIDRVSEKQFLEGWELGSEKAWVPSP